MATRGLVRFFTGVAFMATVLFGSSAPVSAKGPESATITGPWIDRPIELMDGTNPDLVARLIEQTALWYGSGDPLTPEKRAGELGPSYTLTWINSGPPGKSAEKRTIRQVIYLAAENGPIIHTPEQEALEGWEVRVTGWFVASSGLRDTLPELGAPVSAPSSTG
jgi:hypothetical protein